MANYLDDAIASFDGTFTTDHPMATPKSSVCAVLRHIACDKLACEAVAAELMANKKTPKASAGFGLPFLGEDVRAILLTLTGDKF